METLCFITPLPWPRVLQSTVLPLPLHPARRGHLRPSKRRYFAIWRPVVLLTLTGSMTPVLIDSTLFIKSTATRWAQVESVQTASNL